jgi:hypothetical protein
MQFGKIQGIALAGSRNYFARATSDVLLHGHAGNDQRADGSSSNSASCA